MILRATSGGGVRFDVRVTPRASKAGLAGVRDGRLLVRVTAPPVDDAANEALRRILADILDLPIRSVQIASGESSRNKSIEVNGIAERECTRRLAAALNPGRHIIPAAN